MFSGRAPRVGGIPALLRVITHWTVKAGYLDAFPSVGQLREDRGDSAIQGAAASLGQDDENA
eukprot:9479560-Pyramimonas_sp.AAC.1